MTLDPDDQAACNDPSYNPEWWFPEAPWLGRTGNERGKTDAYKLMLATSLEAIEVCHNCPLMANGKCLEYAMQDISTIDYGIYAGTLPIERREAVGSSVKGSGGQGIAYQIAIRQAATKAGFIPPYIERGERPKSTYGDYFPIVQGEEFRQRS